MLLAAPAIPILRDAMHRGLLRGKEVGNARDENKEDKELWRLTRGDDEEFALSREVKDLRLWSSIGPHAGTPLAETIKVYAPDENRNADLGTMKRLRGPNKHHTGTCAWRLKFPPSDAVLDFIVGA